MWRRNGREPKGMPTISTMALAAPTSAPLAVGKRPGPNRMAIRGYRLKVVGLLKIRTVTWSCVARGRAEALVCDV